MDNQSKVVLSNEEKLKEIIRFKTEHFKLVVIATITVVGGTIGLLLTAKKSGSHIVFIVFGLMVTVVGVVRLYRLFTEIKRLLNHGL